MLRLKNLKELKAYQRNLTGPKQKEIFGYQEGAKEDSSEAGQGNKTIGERSQNPEPRQKQQFCFVCHQKIKMSGYESYGFLAVEGARPVEFVAYHLDCFL